MSDNPQAFPSVREVAMVGGGKHRDDIPGMTLRDWFAGQALGAMAEPRVPDDFNGDAYKFVNAQAVAAFAYADAMLAARTPIKEEEA